MSKYPFEEIEPKWQKYWDENKTFKCTEDEKYPKDKRRYVLDMFPYPSAAGLHVGHPEGYTATDIYCRYLRMNGYNVLHPMGYDAFGLPAENAAMRQNAAKVTGSRAPQTNSQIRSWVATVCEPSEPPMRALFPARPKARTVLMAFWIFGFNLSQQSDAPRRSSSPRIR